MTVTPNVNPFSPVPAPALAPLRYGLYAAATPIDEPNGQWEWGTVWDDSDNCTQGGLWQPCCGRFESDGTNALRKVTITVTFTARPAVGGGAQILATAVDNWTGSPFTGIDVNAGALNGSITSDGVPVVLGTLPGACGTEVAVDMTTPPGFGGAGIQSGTLTITAEADLNVPCSGVVALFNTMTLVPEPTASKTFSDSTFVFGDPFVVYDGRICPNYTDEQLLASARNRLTLSEPRQVEQMFWRGPNTPSLTDASTVVLNRNGSGIGQPVSPQTGVALLEGCLADSYLGTGLIHAPRWTAGLFNREYQISYDLGTSPILRTAVGTGWVFGAGYPGTGPAGQPAPAATPAPGQAWIYATGQVVIRRAPIIANAARDRTGCVTALAERTVVLGIQCDVRCAVLVDFTLCDCPPAA